LVALWSSAAGCGDDDGRPLDSGAGDGGGTDTGGSGGEDYSVVVIDGDGAPRPGALVGFDAPGGGRFEETTGADGTATFPGVDWSVGEGTVTVVADGYVPHSHVQITPEVIARDVDPAGNHRLLLAIRQPPERVTIRGTIANPMSIAHRFNVIPAVVGATVYNDVGPTWSAEVPVAEPFRLTALEYEFVGVFGDFTQTIHAATTVESPALTADTTIDLDLATPITFQTVDGTLPRPPADHPLSGADPYFVVSSFDSDNSEFLGGATAMAPTADGTGVDYTASWFDPGDVTEPLVRFIYSDPPLITQVIVDGFPTAGIQDVTFLVPPDVVTPAFGDALPLHDPITLGASGGDDIAIGVAVIDGTESYIRWAVLVPPGSTTFAVPELPASVPESDVIVAGETYTGRIQLCDRRPDTLVCQRQALGRAFDLTP
jgi:hypothetical protein